MSYQKFLEVKETRLQFEGVNISDADMNPRLFPFQRAITQWALKKGRAAIFADTGLGKTLMQLEWASHIPGSVLIVAPLSVARQTVREGAKFGYDVNYCRAASAIRAGLNITNYEMIEHFDPAEFDGVVLDESSILKAFDGVTRKKLTDMFSLTRFRLCCTATPAPNDQSEISNHSEFLGVMTGKVMLATYFVHDGLEWRLKGHGVQRFYEWMASWAMSVRMPSDIGFSDDGYVLPPLNIIPDFLPVDYQPEGELFHSGLKGIRGRMDVRRSTMDTRIARAVEVVNDSDEQWIVWCGMNEESKRLTKAISGSVEVKGDDTPEYKAECFEKFQDGEYRVMVTKPKIAGFGMNFQNAHNMIFVGLSDSFEAYYQCVRRSYRFGQKREVNAHIVLSGPERVIYDNVKGKEIVAKQMAEELIKNVQVYELGELGVEEKPRAEYAATVETGDTFEAINGDSCVELKRIADDSIDLSVYSPPFANLFTYSNSNRDIGNSKDWDEFFEHFKFIVAEIFRVTKPGRVTAVHCADIPAMLSRDGYIGLRDLPGAFVQAYIEAGWVFHGRVTIDKDPQAQAIRTHSKALLFVQMEKDSSWSRPAVGDFVLAFRKPGENAVPVTPVKNGEMTRETWIEWARPVWYNIHESDTLQYTTARDPNDERHICPLQLGTIERCIKLWSNPGETILTPFGGIGSEGYEAIRLGRKAKLIELKPSYFKIAVQNLRAAEGLKDQGTLFENAAG